MLHLVSPSLQSTSDVLLTAICGQTKHAFRYAVQAAGWGQISSIHLLNSASVGEEVTSWGMNSVTCHFNIACFSLTQSSQPKITPHGVKTSCFVILLYFCHQYSSSEALPLVLAQAVIQAPRACR